MNIEIFNEIVKNVIEKIKVFDFTVNNGFDYQSCEENIKHIAEASNEPILTILKIKILDYLFEIKSDISLKKFKFIKINEIIPHLILAEYLLKKRYSFNYIVNKRIEFIKIILMKKAKEYATEDRLYNFKRAAIINKTTYEEALLGMFMKHIVSVLDLLEGRLEPKQAIINEKFGDAINYIILLKAIILDCRE
jgi:hypothetical protein